ncbi:MAG: rod shape-determining protein MreD [Sphingobacteriales bacterium]|nr:rod shape-determining protein MreD [Sphingobacteriales bacterium]MCC7223738.1 rod shape-determining protein MreD [Chitinophagales bacterium]
MNNVFIYQGIRCLLIVLLQVLILNQIELSRYLSPYIYPLFILTLPLETPIWAVLLIGFGTGFVIDIFGNTPGLHTAATVLLAYVRGIIISRQKQSIDYAGGQQLELSDFGLGWFFAYALACIGIHHFSYFLLEIFSLSYMPYVLAKTIASGALSLALIMLSRYLSGRNIA